MHQVVVLQALEPQPLASCYLMQQVEMVSVRVQMCTGSLDKTVLTFRDPLVSTERSVAVEPVVLLLMQRQRTASPVDPVAVVRVLTT